MDDTSDLSSAEELAILNRARRRTLDRKDWGFLVKTATGTATTAGITLPSDFSHFPTTFNAAGEPGQWIYLGSGRASVKVVPIRDREAYQGDSTAAYLDRAGNALLFCGSQTSALPYEMAYVYAPADLASLSDPLVIPARFADALVYGMATDSWVIQQAEKARSYLSENNALYEDALRRMAVWDAKDYV